MIEQIPFVIMTVFLLAILFVVWAVLSGDDRDGEESDDAPARSRE